jgi:hypothetical protein
MSKHLIKIAVITAGLATAPAMSVAANSPTAMDSCVKAFMASLANTMAKTPKLRETRYIDDRIVESSGEWSLMARDANDHHPIARAVCTVNQRGQVINLHQEPLQSVDLL